MAGIITISPGHDASYPWRQIGTSADAGDARRSSTEYYLSPADKGGEPPGRWRGSGVAELGFAQGQVIDRAVFERLYGEFIDPRDPAGEIRLGRAPQRFRSADEIFAELVALEPEATAERRAELMIEAKAKVRSPVQYFDATFSVSKSITLLHASALANAVRSAAAGDQPAEAYWQQAADDVWACIQAGNQAALDYLQREAGYTRSGYHGRRADGVSVGRWEDAHAFVIGSFAQHTSRDGDPQLHIHNLILNRVQRERDGAWRTLDSRALYEHRGAAAAIAALVMESALSREFGTGWVSRADGHGREVRGVSQALMDEFSSRRQSITALTARLAAEFEAQHGRAPDAHALGKLRQWANHASRRAKQGEPLDLAAEVRRWSARARAGEAGALEPVLPAVSTRRRPGAEGAAEPRPIWELSPEQAQDLMAQALARAQQAQPTWRKADLIRRLGELLPDDVVCRDDAAAVALLADLAQQAIAGGAGQEVLALEAPEWPRVPDALRRTDGRSVYQPHGGTRYATLAQLNLEERLTAQAQQTGAPRLEPELAAQLLGADPAQIEAQISAPAQSLDEAQTVTGAGLRLDQAAAAYLALTSDRRAEVLVGPAGSGKTRVAGVIARLWQAAGMGQVLGLTTSQAARNVLVEAGVHLADNTAAFLGHLAGQREALGSRPVGPGTLLLLDEASMMSIADLAAIVRLAAEHGCRVLITGDHEQLAAVEGGGGMLMLARQLGYIQLGEPVRFSNEWERTASLRLRRGDTTVLTDYDEQGRLRGGRPEEAIELASRAFVADQLAGRDALLLARTGGQARELSRRVRDDLIRYGLVSRGPTVWLRHHAVASPGDLITARANQRSIPAGEPGRWLTNRDVLRLEALGPGTVTVRRLLGRVNGQPRWSDPFEVPRTYLFFYCDLAYATTPHAAQGRTVDIAHVLVDGLGDRQWLYVAMTRGRHANYAYCITGFPQLADTSPGARPAAELRRARRRAAEQSGQPETAASHPGGTVLLRDPVSVLTGVVNRDGTVLSATEALRGELSNADHLGVLGAIWYDLARRAQAERFERQLRETLPPVDAEQALEDPACTWLWRTLREVEAAGLDAGHTLRAAMASRSLTDARHPARVLDARIRRTLTGITPARQGSWSLRVPQLDDPELRRFMTELATAMDDRVLRLGQHLARTAPAWAVRALGPLPAGPVQRAEWESRAGDIGAYRELYGYDAEHDAIGPEPGRTSPEARADWHTAFAALGHVDGIDLRGCSDGQLRLHRASYERETSWAPPHVGEELRLARLQARAAGENATRAGREASAAADPAAATRHQALAGMWRAMAGKATLISGKLAAAQETRRQWEAQTAPARHLAIAADLELRRRHPGLRLASLASAEPQTAAPDSVVHSTRGSRDDREGARPGSPPRRPAMPVKTETQLREELGLTPDSVGQEIPLRIRKICDRARAAQELIGRLRSQPSAAIGRLDLRGTAWPEPGRRDRAAAIVEPPAPDIVPASAILQRVPGGAAAFEPEPE